MTARAPVEVVTSFLDAFQCGDFELARSFLSNERFSYRGPIDRFDSADEFIVDISRIGAILKRIELRRIFADGDEVCAIVTYVTTIEDIANTRAANWARVENERIVSIESFLDARAYARMFDPQLTQSPTGE